MLYLALYILVFLLWMGIELLLAPKGFEDSRGFHYGSPKIRRYRKAIRRFGHYTLGTRAAE
jgi:hypothetical protein